MCNNRYVRSVVNIDRGAVFRPSKNPGMDQAAIVLETEAKMCSTISKQLGTSRGLCHPSWTGGQPKQQPHPRPLVGEPHPSWR